MGFYQDRLLPRLQDKVMGRRPMAELRSRVCSGLRGRVLEVGFGTGLNAAHYPAEVSEVLAIEPSAVCVRIATPRMERSSVPVHLAGLDGQHLDLPADSVDAVLSTWTLCTIPDVTQALDEMRRVLKPGGSFHFIEHGHAPDNEVARWQTRIEPLNKRFAGGCHLTRRIPSLIEGAGFTLEHLDTYYFAREPKIFGHFFEGRAVKR